MTAIPEWIPYTRGMKIIRVLADMVTLNSPSTGLYVLVGPPNNGKTAIVDRLRWLYPTSVDPISARSHFPILALDMPPRPTGYCLLWKALQRTGAPLIPCLLDQGTYLSGVLGGVGTRLIVLDDAQHILAGTPSQRQLFLSFWSSVAANVGAAILLVGTAQLFELGSAVEKANVLSMPVWPLDHDFADMVRALEKHISPEHGFIAAEDIPILHGISAGRLGALVAVMTSVAGLSPMLDGELQEQVAMDLRFQRAADHV